MKKVLLIIILILSVQLAHGQNKIYLGLNISPSVSFPVVRGFSDYLDEKSDISFGICGAYFFSRHIFLKFLFTFNQKGFTVNGIPNTRAALNGTWNIDETRNYEEYPTFNDTETYQSFMLPLTINFKLSKLNKASLLFSGGTELGYLYNVKYIFEFSSGGQETYQKRYSNFIGGLNLGVGLFQPIGENYLLLIAPKYSYAFYPDLGEKSLNFHSVHLDVEFYFEIN